VLNIRSYRVGNKALELTYSTANLNGFASHASLGYPAVIVPVNHP
jgi:hypothetical protein